ncbi:MAG: serine/threonine protein kinase, partial [Verrucomicrobia bacterium]|nr:serine/threonine protein kinase [Verrucomicrobiota bacterium]
MTDSNKLDASCSDLEMGDTIVGLRTEQRLFERYVLKHVLGRGGMGIVWLAQDERLDRPVALKFMPELLRLDPAATDDLKRETRRCLQLAHSHIVHTYDLVGDHTRLAIAMEYIDGSTLAALRVSQPARVFEPAELAPWVAQLCDALAYAHESARIVHRDLKPANLMLNRGGELKVADFGLARSLADSYSRVSQLGGTSSGTLIYMSPQQLDGEPSRVADDIYALGATLYELLTSKPPFYTGDILSQVRSKIPPPVTRRREDLEIGVADVGSVVIPNDWEQTIAACLAKSPAERPAGAREVASRLGLALSGASSSSRRRQVIPAPVLPPLPPPMPAPPAPMMMPPAAALPPRARRTPVFVLICGLLGLALALACVGYFVFRAMKQKGEPAQTLSAAASPGTPAPENNETPSATTTATNTGGSLNVRVTPVAEQSFSLAQNGRVLRSGLTPARLDRLPAGAYEVALSDWPGYHRVVQLRDGGEPEEVVFDVLEGRVFLRSLPPGARVSLNGRELGRTPLELSDVGRGERSFRVEADGYEAETRTLMVPGGGRVEALVALNPLPAPLQPTPFVPPPPNLVPANADNAEAVRAFVRAHMQRMIGGQMDAMLADYAPVVEFQQYGRLGVARIRADRQTLYDGWPYRHAQYEGPIEVQWHGNVAQVAFRW